MILQALHSLYGDLTRRGELPLRGWAGQKVSYALALSPEGELLQVIPLQQEELRGKKTVLVPQIMTLPAAIKKTSGAASNYLWENAEYFLGIEKHIDTRGLPPEQAEIKEKKKRERTKLNFQTARELHHQLLDLVDHPTARAILRFFDTWDQENAMTHPALQSELSGLLKGGNLVFLVNGGYAQDVPALREAWQSRYESFEGETMQCLVTGKEDVIERVHPSVKGVRGAASSGGAIVSFNAPAFCSYGREQSFNAPVGKHAAFAYTSALNYLLADRRRVHEIGDATVVSWAEGGEPQYTDLFNMQFYGDDPGTLSEDDVRAVVGRLSRGLDCPEQQLHPGTQFYVLGLSPAKARISVRFFYRDSFGALMAHIRAHQERLSIVKPAYDTRQELEIGDLLQETVNKNAKDKAADPALSGALSRAIFTGGLYPASLLNQVTIRIRAEREITRGRAAIIKAYYLRNPHPDCPEEVLQVGLQENSTNTAYNLGRLFSLYEELQEAAIPGLNTTIKDKYLNAAASNPATIFPVLDNLAQKHLRKLDEGSAIWFNKRIIAIKGLFGEEYPTRLTLPQQGSFNLGYYHQTQKRYEKKEK